MMKSRDSYFDNAKFILILLVVFGHIIRSFIDDNELMLNIYKFVYTFHMPAFILISGYFAKGFNKPGYVKKVAKKLILPYLIFQGLYSVYYYLIQDESVVALDPLDPQWSLWFLISLFFWNVLLIPFTKMSKQWAILTAFVIGIAVGYIDFISNYLSLSRTFVFFPIFLIGYYLQRDHFRKVTTQKARLFAASLMVLTFFSYFFLEFDYSWLFGSKPYSEFGEVNVISSFVRLGFYTLTFITTISFLAFIPTRQTFFTHLGTRTFFVYLLHGLFIGYFRNSALPDFIKDYESLTLLVVLSILLTLLLSSNFVKTIAQPVIELRATNLKQAIKEIR
ncbi:acyltransferase family protein [Metabacillus arenae]|uniref:Acyltransferase family protein n=1 Tax=Metabacillus arenae TaxID=2771434 RepID=A0A926NBD7_9BACI|nr:acyltransferase family protein [Metabacillus arenae]MBD1380354.1 acyltransferase family protein [Metabacillus arenae]